MKRELRKQAFIEKSEHSFQEQVDFFSKEAIRSAFEEEKRSSEMRFDKLVSPQAIQSVYQATQDFQSKENLQVSMIKQSTEVLEIPPDFCFKYSHPCGTGSLQECSKRMESGEDLIVAMAYEENLLIGYAIATIKNGECEIEIIDVDCYSRRKAGLAYTLQISGQSFQIGVGHLVVYVLLQECPRPIHVDATHSSSRYIFKSLGFVHDELSVNPCILKIFYRVQQ